MNSMLGFGGIGGDDDDYLSPRARASSVRPVINMSSPQSASDDVSRIRAKYGVLRNTSDSTGYNPPSRSPTSFAGSSYSLSPSSYSSIDSSSSLLGSTSLRRDPLSISSSSRFRDPSASSSTLSPSSLYSSYTRDSHSPISSARTGGGGSYGVTSLAALDASRMRRAQSVTDMYDRPTSSLGYRGSTTFDQSSGGGDFQSKFLDKVRGSGPSFGASASPVSSFKPKGEKPFKSRFLKSTTSFDTGSSSSTGGAAGSRFKSGATNGYGNGDSTTEK